jgi:hypothetical protein
MPVIVRNSVVTNPPGGGKPTPNPVLGLAAPIELTVEAAGALSAPNILTPIAYSDTPPYPLNHARILYDNLLLTSTVTSTGGTGDSLTLSPNTFERWTLTAAANVKYEFSTNVDVDTVCIGAQDFIGETISVYYSATTGGSLVLIGSHLVTDTHAVMFHLTSSVSVADLEIRSTGAGYAGVIYAGEALQMQRPFFSGHTPLPLGAVTDYFSSRTDTGEFIGRQIRRRGYESDASWKHLTDSWYRTYFQPFVESAKINPFFIAWNLLEQDADVGYCWTDADIAPSYMGILDFFEVSMNLKAHG